MVEGEDRSCAPEQPLEDDAISPDNRREQRRLG